MTHHPILDCPPHLLGNAQSFGRSLHRLSFAKLIAIARRIDATHCQAQQTRDAGAALNLDGAEIDDVIASVGAYFALVEAEIERRLSKVGGASNG